MKFIEFTVHTTTEGSELVSDIFWNYTNYGVDYLRRQRYRRPAKRQAHVLGLHGRRSDRRAGQRRARQMFSARGYRGRKYQEHRFRLKRTAANAPAAPSASALWKRAAARSTATTGSTCGKNISAPSISGTIVVCPEWIHYTSRKRANRSSCSIRTWRSARASTKRRPCAWNCLQEYREGGWIRSSTWAAGAASSALPPSNWAQKRRI